MRASNCGRAKNCSMLRRQSIGTFPDELSLLAWSSGDLRYSMSIRNRTIMRIKVQTLVVASIAVCLLSGCHQGQAVPNPMSAFAPAHVPPPATGSYNVPAQYNSGQARAGGDNLMGNLVAADTAVGSGVVQSSFVNRGQTFGTAPVGATSSDLDGYRGTDVTAGNPPPAPVFSSEIQSELPSSVVSPPPRASAPLSWQAPGSGF